jgi:hypothetical protein
MKKFLILFLAVFLFSGCEKYKPSSPAVYTSVQKAPARTYSYSYGIKGDSFKTVSELNYITFPHQYYCIESKMPDFPQAFVFESIIEGKTPIVTVPYTSSVKDMILFAKKAGEVNSPILIDLFPYNNKLDSKYSENYETAYKLLKKFSANSKIIHSYPIGYDGRETKDCDYSGITYYEDDIYNSVERTSKIKDISEDVPSFIFFGVSSYNSGSNTYDSIKASKFISYFYKNICSHTPNIVAVVYDEYKDEKNNYRIIDFPETLEAYKNLKNS